MNKSRNEHKTVSIVNMANYYPSCKIFILGQKITLLFMTVRILKANGNKIVELILLVIFQQEPRKTEK